MHPKIRLDKLIRKATAFLENDVNRDVCRQLTIQAVDCLAAVVGPDHPYTKMVEYAARKGEKGSLSTACGVLWAAKLQLDNERCGADRGNDFVFTWRETSGYLS
jgi:hypothetical protein